MRLKINIFKTRISLLIIIIRITKEKYINNGAENTKNNGGYTLTTSLSFI